MGVGSGIAINNGITNVNIEKFTIKNHSGAGPNGYGGVYGAGNNNSLAVKNCTIRDNVGCCGFYADGPVNNVLLDNLEVFGHPSYSGNPARGIVIWNGVKSNITITNCEVYNNNCCGIELQNGSASGITMTNNNVHDNWDNGMSAVGLNGSVGINTISSNNVTNNGRFGIEIKNPDGNGVNTIVSGNTVSLTGSFAGARPTEKRDIVGIAAFRRALTGDNVDVPTGVSITGNTVSGYVQDNAMSTSEGFGIVVEGTNHTVTGNTVTGNDVAIQQQAGHLPYPGDGDQSDLADQYFGRGNSPISCGNTISGNTISGNGTNAEPRNVGSIGGAGFVTNTNSGETFCTIQAAINDAETLSGHTLEVSPGTYNENINIPSGKNGLVINGPNAGLNDANGSRATEASIVAAANAPVITVNSAVTSYTIDGFRLVGADYLNDVNGSIIWASGGATVSNILNNSIELSSSLTGTKRYIWLGPSSSVNSGSPFISGNINHNIFQAAGTGEGFAGITMQQWSQNFNINANKFVGMIGQRNILIYHPTPTVVISNNELFVSDDGANGGSARELIAVLGNAPTVTAGGIVVQNNFFTTGTGGKGIRIENASTYGANLAINNNHFGGVAGFAIQNSGTGTVTATCNWYGTANAGLIPAKISGSGINYTPWLIGGGDGAGFGFQPTASCTGTPVVISSAVPTHIYCGPTTGSILVTFSGGTSPYDIAWTGGSATGITSPYSITPLAAGPYTITVTDANGSTANASATVLYLPVKNTTQNIYYATIQAAINASVDNDVITVCAGTYTENLTINGKNGLVIKGPNTGLNDANGSRAAEAIVVSASNASLITIESNVSSYTIDGFKLVGADYTSGGNGRMIWSKGIGTVSNILNNVFELTSNDGTTAKRYIWLGPASAGSSGSIFISGSISYNTFNGLGTGTEYQAIIMQQWAQNFNINANKLTGIKGTAEASILVWNPSLTVQVTNNEINNTATNGIGVYLLGAVPTVLGTGGGVVQNNKFGSSATGVAFFTFSGNSFVSNVTNNDFGGTTLGVLVQPASTVAITGTCNWWGTASANAIPSKISVSSPATINYTPWLIGGGDGAAVGFQPTASCTGTPVVISSAVPTHIYCGPTTGSVLVTFSGGTSPYDIAWTGGGSATGITSPYSITPLAAGTYTITVTDANGSTASTTATVQYLPVKNTTQNTYYATIQAAVTAASNNDVIDVCAGTYAENIVVNKSLTINGPNAAISPNSGMRVAEAIIVPATTNTASGAIVTISVSNVNFKGFKVDGDNPSLPNSGVGLGGAYGLSNDAARGIFINANGVTGITISKNIATKLENGIRIEQTTNYTASGGPALFSHSILIDDNKIENVRQ